MRAVARATVVMDKRLGGPCVHSMVHVQDPQGVCPGVGVASTCENLLEAETMQETCPRQEPGDTALEDIPDVTEVNVSQPLQDPHQNDLARLLNRFAMSLDAIAMIFRIGRTHPDASWL